MLLLMLLLHYCGYGWWCFCLLLNLLLSLLLILILMQRPALPHQAHSPQQLCCPAAHASWPAVSVQAVLVGGEQLWALHPDTRRRGHVPPRPAKHCRQWQALHPHDSPCRAARAERAYDPRACGAVHPLWKSAAPSSSLSYRVVRGKRSRPGRATGDP